MNRIKRKIISIIIGICCVLTVSMGSASANEAKKLYFEEKNGTMTWNPVRGSDGNWFMDFTSMVPGVQYEDHLQIENGSKKTYKLYVQAIALEQDAENDQLLELISMKVFLDTEELYDGTASGKEYENGNLQDVIYLGTYEPGKQSQISVQLELNKDVGIECSDKLTKSDWKFMVTEVKETNETEVKAPEPAVPVQTIHTPKTGDTTNLMFYTAMMTGALLLILLIGSLKVWRENDQEK